MDLSRIMAALSQSKPQPQQGRATHPYARLARAMSAMHAPGPTERAQHASSGYAGSYGGAPNEVPGGFQSTAFQNDAFQV